MLFLGRRGDRSRLRRLAAGDQTEEVALEHETENDQQDDPAGSQSTKAHAAEALPAAVFDIGTAIADAPTHGSNTRRRAPGSDAWIRFDRKPLGIALSVDCQFCSKRARQQLRLTELALPPTSSPARPRRPLDRTPHHAVHSRARRQELRCALP